MSTWFNEEFKEEDNLAIGARTSLKIKRSLFRGESKYQKIEILETEDFGNLMLLDDIIMLTEKNEFSYHEMISHIPIFAHPNPKRVLIIGGGDGGTAREVIKHDSIDECVLVEIDEMIIAKSIEYFPKVSTAFNNPKLNLIIDDGIKYLKENKNSFDVIIIDSTDPIGPAKGLFTLEFYQNVFESLIGDGIMCAQAETPYFYKDIQKELFGKLKSIFPFVTMFLSHVPFYPSGTWSFAFSSKKYTEKSNPRWNDMKKMESSLEYFNREIYSSAFALPNFVKKIIS